MVTVVGDDGADEAAYNQCAEQVAIVRAAMVVMIIRLRRGGMMVLRHRVVYSRTAMNGSASVHHGICPVTRATSMHHGLAAVNWSTLMHNGDAMMNGATFVHNRSAFMHHRLAMMG